jgi:tRNA pseudouridine38-40 synthase
LLRRAAGLLKGRRDFRGFSANRGKPVDDTERHVHRIAVSGDGPVIRLRFEGDGFLYKMVRMLVAAMVRVAQGRSPAGDLVLRLEGMDCDLPRDVAPPDGLYLVRVAYRRREQTG